MTSPAIQQRSPVPRATTSASFARVAATHPRHALALAILIMAIVGVRVHESIPLLYPLRLVIVIGYGGLVVLLVESSRAMLADASRDRALRLICLYFGWAIVTSPLALWAAYAVSMIWGCIPIVALCLAVTMCRPDAVTLERSIVGLTVAIIVLGVLSIYYGSTAIDRLSTIGSFDPNDLAAVAALGFPFALGLLRSSSKFYRSIGLAASIVCPYVVISTGSRGGTLAIVAGALVYALGNPGKRRLLMIVLLGAGAAGAWSYAPGSFRERIQSISSLSEDYNSTDYTGRRRIWGRAVGYVKEHPVQGVGLGNFPIAEGGYAERIGIHVKWSAAHNAYIQAFAELGLVGGALFLAILGIGLRRGARLWLARSGPDAPLHRPEFLASLVSFGVSAYFLSHAYFGLFFALVALTSLANRVQGGGTRRRQPRVARGPARTPLARWNGRRQPAFR